MKTTEMMFKFPMRIYDPIQMERLDGEFTDNDIDWVIGYKRIFWEDIVDIGDSFYRGRTIDQVVHSGFNASTISTIDYCYSCAWKREKLEEELDKHIEKCKNNEINNKIRIAILLNEVFICN